MKGTLFINQKSHLLLYIIFNLTYTMKLHKILLILCLSVYITTNAQNSLTTNAINEGTIENQFDFLIKKSQKYNQFKVVKNVWLETLKKSVKDSLNKMKKELLLEKRNTATKSTQINTLTSTLDTSKKEILTLKSKQDTISFLGIQLSKTLFKVIFWVTILTLLALLAFYIVRFKRSNAITTTAEDNLADLEREYNGFRQRSLEREQLLRRKLQDELNKQHKG